MPNDLRQALADADPRAASALEAIYHEHHRAAGFVSTLLDSLADAGLGPSASWLIKHHLEQGARLAAGRLCPHLGALLHWSTRLHLLQCLERLDIDAADLPALERFCRASLQASNTFERAWAYSGFALLARHRPALAEEARALVEHALATEAPSVRARLRHQLASN